MPVLQGHTYLPLIIDFPGFQVVLEQNFQTYMLLVFQLQAPHDRNYKNLV